MIARASKRSRLGLSLAECMIALAIAVTLLTAVGAAFSAATAAINQNDQFFEATQTARVAINRILTEIRRGAVDETSTASSLHLLTDTGTDVTYSYAASTGILSMTIHANGADTTYELARNLSTCQFVLQDGTDYAGNPCVAKVAVTLTARIGTNQIGLSGSAAPRRNLSL